MIPILAIAIVVGFVVYEQTRCTHVNSKRDLTGLFRCPDCNKAGRSYDDMGFDHGYVSRTNPLIQQREQ